MQTLRHMISKYMQLITWMLVAVLLMIIVYIQLINEQRRAYDNSTRTFTQIEQVLEENQKELEEIRQEYRQTCLHNAEIIAKIVEDEPEILYRADELKQIAVIVEVDEIHIFNKEGYIFSGTHPEYYGYSFDSGEQISFFKPMLKDKTLRLVQEITPNTAENNLMQYSALWSKNGEFIVQVGMKPVTIMKETEKNELSYLFSLFRVSQEANYFAIDVESGEVVGSTNLDCVGQGLTEIGLNLHQVANDADGFHAKVCGSTSFCVFKKVGTNYIGRIVTCRNLYQRIPNTVAVISLCFITIGFILAQAVTKYMNRYVVAEINTINEKLGLLASGNQNEVIDVRSSVELSELSDYINRMVKSIADSNRKMSYVLSKTNMYIGIYEYNQHTERVRFSEYIPKILSLDRQSEEQFAADYQLFQEYIDNIRQNPVEDEEGVYRVGEWPEHYIKIEEISDEDEVFGVVIDVTFQIIKRKKIEVERDVDQLTGLYNRRGLDTKLSILFREPEKLGYGALIMIDADGLKKINDTYGHDVGDSYIRKIAEIIKNFGFRGNVAARRGGDEFVLFLYQYEAEEELINTIKTLEYVRYHSSAHVGEKINVPLKFSFGFSMIHGQSDYEALLKEADEKMYQDKWRRKKEESAEGKE